MLHKKLKLGSIVGEVVNKFRKLNSTFCLLIQPQEREGEKVLFIFGLPYGCMVYMDQRVTKDQNNQILAQVTIKPNLHGSYLYLKCKDHCNTHHHHYLKIFRSHQI